MSKIVLAALLVALIASAQAQMPPMSMNMPQAAPPRPGDAAMNCEQIGQEMADLLKKSGFGKNREQNMRDACTLRGDRKVNPADGRKAQVGVMGNAMTTMAAFSNPRVMRLGMLAEEKNCAANAPKPATTAAKDPCDDLQPVKARTASEPDQGAPNTVDPFRTTGIRAPPAPSAGDGADPFVQRGVVSPPASKKAPPK